MSAFLFQFGSLTVEQPAWLLLLVFLPLIVFWSRRSLAALSRGKRYLAIFVRSVVVLLVTLALARVQHTERSDKQTVLFLLDRSKSISSEQVQKQDEWLRLATGKGKVPDRDRVGVLTFAGSVNIEQPPMKGGVYYHRAANPAGTDRTDLAQAFRMALATFPPDSSKRLVLLSDGNQNVGDVLSELSAAQAAGAGVDVIPDLYRRENEVLIERVVVSPNVKQGEQARVRVVLRSTGRAAGSLQLFLKHDDRREEILLDAARRRVVLETGISVFPRPGEAPIDLSFPIGGAYQVEVVFHPDPGTDQLPANNRAAALVNVESRGRILILSTDPAADQVLANALNQEQLETLLTTPDAISLNAPTLQQFDAVILSNVPANLISDEAQRMLRAYVYDLGGGLAMIGGDQSFGAGGWIGSPLAEALPVGLDVKSRREMLRSALVLVVDRSGSMSAPVQGTQTTKLALAIEAAADSANLLSRLDYVGVVGFESQAEWVIPLGPNTNPQRIAPALRNMTGGGGTDMYPALETACAKLERIGEGFATRHVILLTDGEDTSGQRNLLLAQRMAQHKISLTTIAIGDQVNLQLLRQLAETTQQRCHLVQDPLKLPAILTRETRLIHRPFIIEKTFAPLLVNALPDTVAGLGRTGGQLPACKGYVLTEKKDLTETPIVSDSKDQDPILAQWNYGRGKAVAFTSGLWNRWGQNWAGWERFARFWGQTVRWMMRQSKEAGLFDVSPPMLESGQARVTIEAVDADGSFLSGDLLDLSGVVLGPDGVTHPVSVQQTAAGRYEAVVPMDAEGDYVLNLPYILKRMDGSIRATGSVRTGLSVPYSPEYRDLSSNEPLLREVARKGAGRYVSPQTDAVNKTNFFERNLPAVVTHIPRWQEVLTWALFLFLLDVAVRRISVDWKEWHRRLAALLALLSGRRPAEAREVEAVGALRLRREEVREMLKGQVVMPPAAPSHWEPSGPPLARPNETTAPLPFDEPIKTPPIASQPRPQSSAEAASVEGVSERLRKAKKRAREKMQDVEQDKK